MKFGDKMLTTNPITADDLKELIINTMVEYLKNNSVTLGEGDKSYRQFNC